MNRVLEVSNRKTKNGRRKIKIALHKIPDDINETNKNGIHWSETNTRKNIESVKGMPICAEFAEETKEIPLGHGYTSTEVIEGKKTPLFENSEVVGVIEEGKIEKVTINDEEITALCGYGVLFEHRYPRFSQWVKKSLKTGNVDTSIEIVGLEENNNQIIYEGEATDEYRIPKDYCYTGTAIISVLPADSNAIVLECAQANNKNKEEIEMDEKELKALIESTIKETNSVKEDMNGQIAVLNSQIEAKDTIIAEKDTKITELNASIAEVEKALEDLRKEIEGAYEERKVLEDELGKLRAEQRIGELNEAIKDFSDEEKKFAEVEINAFNDDPIKGNIDAIVGKIYAGIGQAARNARVLEQNTAHDTIDIFSEINSLEDADSEDTNIF